MNQAILLCVLALFAGAVRLPAQDLTDTDETPAAETTETGDVVADPDAADVEAPPTHDWEFALQATQSAPQASGLVKVTDGDESRTFTVDVEGVPLVDELDNEQRDVNAYTVWVVPSKDQVKESALAGVITIGPEGTGSFTSTTTLETFGVILSATADGAPERISGVPVLTGIPVTEAAPVEASDAPADASAEPTEDAPDAEPAPQEAVDETS